LPRGFRGAGRRFCGAVKQSSGKRLIRTPDLTTACSRVAEVRNPKTGTARPRDTLNLGPSDEYLDADELDKVPDTPTGNYTAN